MKAGSRGADWCSVLALHIGDNLHYIPVGEAKVLQSILWDDGSAGAADLRRSIEAATGDAVPQPIRLGPNEVAVLRDVLSGDLFIGFPALTGLQSAVCTDYPGKGLEHYFSGYG